MKLLGIIGKPLDHSLSPKMFNAIFKKWNWPYRYLPFQVERAHLKNLIVCMKLVDVAGLNITAPYKEAVLPLLDKLDISAKQCGAVNTIVRRKNQFIGFNTDGEGFVMAMKVACGVSSKNKRVIIIGAGGAARAIAASLAKSGAKKIIFLNRHPLRARKAANSLKKYFPKTEWKGYALTSGQCRRHFPETDIAVQATSASLKLPIPYLPKKSFVCDINYWDKKSPLLRNAKRLSLKTMDGLWMLVYQASLNLTLWTGKKIKPSSLKG